MLFKDNFILEYEKERIKLPFMQSMKIYVTESMKLTSRITGIENKTPIR